MSNQKFRLTVLLLITASVEAQQFSVSEIVNNQSSNYTVAQTDWGKLVTFSATSTASLPQAGLNGLFNAGWYIDIQNRSTGTVTISPSTSTIDGASSLPLTANQGVRIVSDGTNYYTQRGMTGGGSSQTMASQLGDFLPTKTSATVLTIGAGCSTSTPCNVKLGDIVIPFTSTPAATATVSANSGTLLIYIDTSGNLHCDYSGGTFASGNVVGSGCTATFGTTTVPIDAVPLYTWTATSAVWATTGSDKRAVFGAGKTFTQGANVTLTETAGNLTIAATGGGTYNPLITTVITAPMFEPGMTSNSSNALEWGCIPCSPQGFNNFASGVTGFPVAGEFGFAWLRSASGTTGTVSYPDNYGGGSCRTGVSITDSFSGSTPLLFKGWARMGEANINHGDYFFGVMANSCNTFTASNADFSGLYYNFTTNHWQCMIGGVATNAGTGDNSIHTFFVSNAATYSGTTPVANQISVQIDGGSTTTCSGTMPTASTNGYWVVAGGNSSSTASTGAQIVDYSVGQIMFQWTTAAR